MRGPVRGKLGGDLQPRLPQQFRPPALLHLDHHRAARQEGLAHIRGLRPGAARHLGQQEHVPVRLDHGEYRLYTIQ